MLPEVEQYATQTEAAQTEYSEHVSAERATYNENRCQLTNKIFSIRINAAAEVRETKLNAAWDLLKGSPDTAVAWIARNCGDWRHEALLALKALPITTLAQIQEIADENDWCEENWGPFRDKALADGIIEGTSTAAARRALRNWFTRNHSDFIGEVKRLDELVDAVVDAELQAVAAEQAATAAHFAAEEAESADEEAEEQATEPHATVKFVSLSDAALPQVAANFVL